MCLGLPGQRGTHCGQRLESVGLLSIGSTLSVLPYSTSCPLPMSSDVALPRFREGTTEIVTRPQSLEFLRPIDCFRERFQNQTSRCRSVNQHSAILGGRLLVKDVAADEIPVRPR